MAKKPENAKPGRDEAGRILPGHSLNPSGKPKDLATRQECQKHLFRRGPELIDAAVGYALGGDKKMLEFLLGKFLPDLAPLEFAPESAGAADDMPSVQAWTVAELQARQGVQ